MYTGSPVQCGTEPVKREKGISSLHISVLRWERQVRRKNISYETVLLT